MTPDILAPVSAVILRISPSSNTSVFVIISAVLTAAMSWLPNVCVADAEVSVSFVVKVTALLCILTACICLTNNLASLGAVS